jgi:hypothetical protein
VFATHKPLACEEGGGFAEEEGELVVVDPVACAGDSDELAVGDGLEAGVGFGNWEETFEAPEEQRGARDLGQHFDGVFDVVAVGWEDTCEIVELPEERAVGFPVSAVEGEMAGYFVG